MEQFSNEGNAAIIVEICRQIETNKEYLSDIDGLIGDGDHGVNMNKGFSIARGKIVDTDSFSVACKKLGDTLLLDIGGSMGPIYGSFFRSMASVTKSHDTINMQLFASAMEKALNAIMDIGGANVGDKTLVDTLYPAIEALKAENNFHAAIDKAVEAAEAGMSSTKNMVAKIGRSARLGERSIGVLDAGSVSCFIILKSLMESIKQRLQ
jgi:dihydroxyacetone kinase-like protein